MVRVLSHERERAVKVPSALVKALAEAQSAALAAWREAREAKRLRPLPARARDAAGAAPRAGRALWPRRASATTRCSRATSRACGWRGSPRCSSALRDEARAAGGGARRGAPAAARTCFAGQALRRRGAVALHRCELLAGDGLRPRGGPAGPEHPPVHRRHPPARRAAHHARRRGQPAARALRHHPRGRATGSTSRASPRRTTARRWPPRPRWGCTSRSRASGRTSSAAAAPFWAHFYPRLQAALPAARSAACRSTAFHARGEPGERPRSSAPRRTR